ncbi:hypothetical protein PUMCH_004256 [Australozyma saopauloensis]|uniref:Stress response RCI peptide n=1 Tax=Australozyma saopauloensis TaxID=291208 RepID=A0AAX4HE54_9ASCO|nr:hypothetical protein PUMCH_004256 [[Candida] saopauloensis]
MCGCLSDICLIILLVLFPPLPVWIRRGLCSADGWINVLLCILGYFPGLIHSWYIIAKYPPCSGNHGSKVYYVYQNSGDLEAQRHSHQNSNNDHHHHHHHTHSNVTHEPMNHTGPNYGSTNGEPSGAPPSYSVLPQGK